MLLRKRIDGHEPGVVPRALILRTRIAKTNDEFHGRPEARIKKQESRMREREARRAV
jgi:hypothetical protein